MANFRPAGLSDDEFDSDDEDGFYERPARQYLENPKKKLEIKIQDAIINGSVKELEKIIACELNNDVNLKLDSGWTPLTHACFHAQETIVESLLRKGSDPNLDSDSVIPLMVACSNSSASNESIDNIVTNLIEKGCLLNVTDKYGQTPLMRAISSGRVSVVQRLLDSGVNIEANDSQGWTALFWAVHHNQPEILELLIKAGARLTGEDKQQRTPLDIADIHDYKNIVQILKRHMGTDEEDEQEGLQANKELQTWQEFYPGIEKGVKPEYRSEVPHLLYGMSCERLTPLLCASGLSLRSFLLLEDEDMQRMGIELPYERQRLTLGLRNFHLRGWKMDAVAGLYATKTHGYTILDCLTTLGTHMHQIYILEATLQYTLREYNRVHKPMKFEPPDSPTMVKLKQSAQNILTQINSIRSETKKMKKLLKKISRCNPQPADLIREKSVQERALRCARQVVVVCSLGLLVYHAKNVLVGLVTK